ncbi:hypothetical protein [Faecalibaculum rodentium]|uniref:Uncharacterized protein n=1 Tax=Faecalibaculum rodentium TaxID=1702221 RepID=A0A140DVI0_9FIRM|nr:hypothetical protein [Faecalibaculum rodentium]AMK54657.1 hypothetical protein AALO17_15230 [Faecalibaculum rodentium]
MNEIFDPILTDFDTWEKMWADDNLNQGYISEYNQGRLEGFLEAKAIIEEYIKKS